MPASRQSRWTPTGRVSVETEGDIGAEFNGAASAGVSRKPLEERNGGKQGGLVPLQIDPQLETGTDVDADHPGIDLHGTETDAVQLGLGVDVHS